MPIIGNLPNNLANGTTADATQVMADFNAIVNSVNANAASITGVQASSYNYAADTGTVNALIISPSNPPTVLLDGMEFRTKAANTNTSSTVTAQIGGIPAVGVVIDQAGTLPVIGSIIQNMYYRLVYSSGLGKLILKDPSRVTFSSTLTYVGGTTAPTVTAKGNFDGYNCSFIVPLGLIAVSNSTNFTVTGLPSFLAPTTTQSSLTLVTDNGTASNGAVVFTAGSATIILSKVTGYASSGGGFTASGQKGWPNNGGGGTQVGLFTIQVNP